MSQPMPPTAYRLAYRKVALFLACLLLGCFTSFSIGGLGSYQTAEAFRLPFFGKKQAKKHKPAKAGKAANPKPASGKNATGKVIQLKTARTETAELKASGAPVPDDSKLVASVAAPVTALVAIESGVRSATALAKPLASEVIVKQSLFRNAFLSRPPIPALQAQPIAAYIQLNNKKVPAGDARLFAEAIVYFCQFYRVNPKLVASMIAVESSYRPDAISSSGAIGLGQLKPDTANWLAVSDPFDPIENIGGMTRYLAWLIQKYNGSYDHAVSAYYQGPGTVDRNGITEACIPYLYKVNGALAKF